MSQSPNIPTSLSTSFPWSQDPSSIWFASSFILQRNLSRYNFPSKLPAGETDQVQQTLISTLQQIDGMASPKSFQSQELSASDRELFYEHFLFLKGFQEPPNGSAMVVDEAGQTLALINMGNHLELHGINTNQNLSETWNKLAHVERQIEEKHSFAFSPKFGYLTSDPSHCGTGLTVNAFLHLPALIHTGQLEGFIRSTDEDEILFMGLSGDLMDLVGDVIIIQNNYCIGMSEEQILHSIQTAASKLISAERTMRNHLQEETNIELMDLVSKGFGLLVHSVQLETKEALDLLSVMKLGLYLGHVSRVSNEKLNELFFKCRRGHFTHLFPQFKENEEIAKARAEFLQKELYGIALTSELE